MFTRSDWTRRGLGRQILDACEAAARAEGFSRVVLMATMPGAELYSRYGFQVIERLPILLPDGTVIDGALMDKRIE